MKTIIASIFFLLALLLPAYAFYDPSTGRWLSRDPIAESGGWNLYAYVNNNPVSHVDPLGLEDQTLYPPGSKIFQQAALFNPAGFYSFGAHGNPDSTVLNQRTWLSKYATFIQPLDGDAVAQRIKNDPKWKAGTPIIETVCNGGTGGAKSQAARVRTVLNTDVYAADATVWFGGGINGKPLNVFIAPANSTDPSKPDLSKIMPWTKFSRDGSIIMVKDPFGYDPK